MDLRESLQISWRSVRAHKLRSALTTLGIIIGIGAVVAFMIFGASFKADFVGEFTEDSEPAVLVYSQQQSNSGLAIGSSPIFTESDLADIRELGGVKYASPVADLAARQLSHDGETNAGALGFVGTTPEQFTGSTFVEGQTFESGSKEAVITKQVNSNYDWNISTGENVTVYFSNGESANVTVVGIINQSTGIQGAVQQPPVVYLSSDRYYDATVVSPNTGENERAYSMARVGVENSTAMTGTQENIERYLQDESDAMELKQTSYTLKVQSTSEVFSSINSFLGQITSLITSIAAISLIVGSIGIANIMLVSVTERTREIGIMKAVGARKRDILQLFLAESIVLSVIGAILGLALGTAGGALGAMSMDMPLRYPAEGFLLAVVVGVVVGIVAGLYPAWRAVRIDPIEALRYE